jgi:hypothetical protein
VKPRAGRLGSPLATAALCGLLVAAGCSDDEPAPAVIESTELEANARAAAVNVGLADLPEGYVAVARSGEDDSGASIPGCVEGIQEATVAEAASPTFGRQTGAGLTFLASGTSVLSSPEAAERLFASLRAEPVVTCLSTFLDDAFANLLPTATSDDPLDLALDPAFPADLGSNNLRLTGEAMLAREDGTLLPVSASLVFIQTGDILSSLVFGGVREPFPIETAQSLATALAMRQSDATGG